MGLLFLFRTGSAPGRGAPAGCDTHHFPDIFMLASAKALFLIGVIALNGARGATCHDDRINYWQGSA
jgi:hypothetical protein